MTEIKACMSEETNEEEEENLSQGGIKRNQ